MTMVLALMKILRTILVNAEQEIVVDLLLERVLDGE